MIPLEIHVDDEEVEQLLNRTMASLSQYSFASFFREKAIPFFRERADRRFEAEGDDASGDWAELSWATQEIREGMGYPRDYPINIRTRTLRDWVVMNEGVVSPTGDGAKMVWPGGVAGETAEKFITAQVGKADPATGARPVVAASEVDLTVMEFMLYAWINEWAGY